jgi:hypothetical protein
MPISFINNNSAGNFALVNNANSGRFSMTVAGTAAPIIAPALVLDLDAANYSALPTNGSTIAGTGAYTITMTNANASMAWNSNNGGVFTKSTGNTTDQLYSAGINYSTSTQQYTVFMAYKLSTTAQGRLLNANSAAPDWLLGSYFSPSAYINVFYPGNTVNLTSDAADTAWHFIWGTGNGSNLSQLYIATNTAPAGTYKTGAFVGGFNGIRLFGRYASATTSSEIQTADIGFVKVYNGVLTLTEIQALYNFYKARFGY